MKGTTVEAVEQDMVLSATKLAKKWLDDGTASSQIVAIYAKEGTEEARLKRRKLVAEIDVLEAKAEAYKSATNEAELTENALNAFKKYSGNDDNYDGYEVL